MHTGRRVQLRTHLTDVLFWGSDLIEQWSAVDTPPAKGMERKEAHKRARTHTHPHTLRF
jgi:hypothetical protein